MKITTSYQATNKADSLLCLASDIIDWQPDNPKMWAKAARIEAIADGYNHIAVILKKQEELDRQFEALETRLLRRR